MAYNPLNINGQAASANSSPVVIASDQSAIAVVTTNPTANPETGLAKDGTDITTPSPMPTGGVGIRGWLSAIWTKLNNSLSITNPFLSNQTGT